MPPKHPAGTAGRTAEEMREVLSLAFVSFAAFAEHTLSPAQRRIATERAGNCLWALGIDHSYGYGADRPDPLGETVEAAPVNFIHE